MFVARAITCAKQSNKEAKLYILVVPVFPGEPNEWIVCFPLVWGGVNLSEMGSTPIRPWFSYNRSNEHLISVYFLADIGFNKPLM